MNEKSLYLLMAFCLLICSWTALAASPTLKDDAYHYLHNGIDDQFYTEWWYFNGIADDKQFFVSYIISDPENRTGFRMIRATAAVLEDGQPPAMGFHDSRGFGADRNSPSLDIDNSGITALNDSAYHVWGAVEEPETGAPLQWDLIYQAFAPPWFGSPVQLHVGHIPTDWMKWLVYMPSAEVSGTFEWNNQTWNVSATGYHDHNWGRWAFNDPQWNWAELSIPEDDFSLALGEVIGEQKNTMLGMNYQGESIEFKNRQVNVSHQDFTLDPVTSRGYPVTFRVTADNGEWKLDMNATVKKNLPLIVAYPRPMVSYVIFEQVSLFEGALSSRKGEAYQFNATGFSEYTTHLFHPLIGRVNATDPGAVTITAANQHTGQTKIAEPSTSGWFSFDANYQDYLINSSAPWIDNGDIVAIKAGYPGGEEILAEVAIDLNMSRQDVGAMDLG